MRSPPVTLVMALVIASAGCAASESGDTAISTPEPGVIHVHSLDVNPADGKLYAATHTGLFAVSPNGTVERVGERWHDLMGFTIAGPDDLVASGHPDMSDPQLNQPDVPPLLGLVTSEDGVDWQPLSLFGEVDFHAISAAHGRIYGWDSTSGRFLVSEDRRSWETRSEQPLLDFAVSPDDPDLIVGATERGVVHSDNGGRSWQSAGNQEAAVLAWNADGLFAVAPDGTVLEGEGAGEVWRPRGDLGGAPEALHAGDGLLYAAVAERGLLQSPDRGATWTVLLAVEADGGAGH